MNCPKCKSADIDRNHEHADTLGIVCVCVCCESTWIDGEEKQTFSDGEGRRALQSAIDRADFDRAFNDPDGLGL